MNINDLLAPFDPTGYAAITGGQLLQFLQGATPSSDRGLVLYTTDVGGNPIVPNATITTIWQRYMWIRVSANAVTAYVWNPYIPADPTLLNWQSINIAGIGVGSITGIMIANNTIQDINIANLSYSKLTGAPTGLPPSGHAGGVLAGFYPNPTIGGGSITTAMIANLAITNALLALASVGVTNLIPNGVGLTMIRTNAGATAVEWFVPPLIFTTTGIPVAANANKVLVVNNGATDYTLITPAALVASGIGGAGVLFTSAETAIAVGPALNVAHGLGSIPSKVRMVIRNKVGELGYTAGDEVDAACVFQNNGNNIPSFSFGASATNVFLVFDSASVALQIQRKDTGVITAITAASWKAVIYASL